MNGNHASLRCLAGRRVKGGQQPVAVIKVDQDLLTVRYRRIMAQEMANGLQITANPGKGLAAEGRNDITGVIAGSS